MATIYTESNLRLAQGNEKYRATIIAAASKYTLTPQSIAAMIGAEATSDPDGTWRADSNEDHPKKAQGLAQFFPDAWTAVFKYPPSLLCQDCKSMSEEEWMSKRLEAKYAIDGAGAYAALNLRQFASDSGWDVESLAPEDKAKLAYMLHHEGVRGTTRLLMGRPDQYTAEQAAERLAKQLKSVEKANQLVLQHHGKAVEAYKSWFFSYIDTKIDVNFFTVQDKQEFAKPPRNMAEIVEGLGGGTRPAHPQPRPEPAASNGKPASSSTAMSRAVSATGSAWFDPLEICTLRTAHLKSKGAAEFGMTRNLGTRAHQGIDLAAEPGTPIRAVANGIVYMAPVTANSDYAYGNTLVLEVGINDLPPAQAKIFKTVNPGRETIGFFYAHLSEFQYPIDRDSQGNILPVTVHAGDPIGKTGCTGNAKGMNNILLGAHLHFEVRQEAKKRCIGLANRVDPLPFIVICTNH
ncbi:M23 family metallopeptidase [Paraburkholderia sp. MPAMCS5]|uniref:M23 family metallopeptidase n=1 Tax=Paraburkholderia sp. MPAMCS5 TaxID=3112563 RepID=UPI002E196801|nr:M23 family metallopeptidase [Paraburkholderia sp. MPAMCS5]